MQPIPGQFESYPINLYQRTMHLSAASVELLPDSMYQSVSKYKKLFRAVLVEELSFFPIFVKFTIKRERFDDANTAL